MASVSDPHEIANILGIDGVRFMIANARQSPFKFCFGAPSCVPATPFESAGGTLGVAAVAELLALPEIGCLSEMMNFPGVLEREDTVMAKMAAAKAQGKPIDGHAPGLRGDRVRAYVDAGISTDHECIALDEALEKLRFGMRVIIREGSAAKNFDALIPILEEYPHMVMFCSDDKHPDNLVEGHIDELVRRAIDDDAPGITTDLDRRLTEHNAGRASKYTRTRRPVELAWFESAADRGAASQREAAIKKLPRRDKAALIARGR